MLYLLRKMKIRIMILPLLLAVYVSSVSAQKPYSLTVMADYGYNRTWLSHGNLDVQAFMPVNPHVELEAKARLSTANVYAVSAMVRPTFALPVGDLFVETELLYNAIVRAHQHDLCTAVSLGYRMDYVSVQVGMFARVMAPFDRNWHRDDKLESEPFNLLYRLEVFCRPQSSRWNINAIISNKDDYQMERMWQLLFALGTYYDVNEHWRVLGQVQCKPTGIFHQVASFYGAQVRAGFAYRF